MSLSAHGNSKEKYVLILGECVTQGLDGIKLIAEKKYLINVTKTRKKFVLNLYYIDQIVIYLLMVQKLLNSKQKILKS